MAGASVAQAIFILAPVQDCLGPNCEVVTNLMIELMRNADCLPWCRRNTANLLHPTSTAP